MVARINALSSCARYGHSYTRRHTRVRCTHVGGPQHARVTPPRRHKRAVRRHCRVRAAGPRPSRSPPSRRDGARCVIRVINNAHPIHATTAVAATRAPRAAESARDRAATGARARPDPALRRRAALSPSAVPTTTCVSRHPLASRRVPVARRRRRRRRSVSRRIRSSPHRRVAAAYVPPTSARAAPRCSYGQPARIGQPPRRQHGPAPQRHRRQQQHQQYSSDRRRPISRPRSPRAPAATTADPADVPRRPHERIDAAVAPSPRRRAPLAACPKRARDTEGRARTFIKVGAVKFPPFLFSRTLYDVCNT